ncbi:hypothetical protein C922_01532 [Plasmodium inui San Antonio 1]|uniref:Uncharacterized protein n=1 Tax=Plasmodium inui San Antonio 1 TaxID=1237626 RepID=W7A8A2_9APIC|nr:hypothetical protein C922_01532 [Plasmodium inui San Antonio 1]EUD67920.1 hypothetical protein C922_01532 [Plasmodium inui San Antonio 1]
MYKILATCYALTTVFFLPNESKNIEGNLNVTPEVDENRYISLDENNINDFINVKENKFLFSVTCRTSTFLSGAKNYVLRKVSSSLDALEPLRSDNVNPENVKALEGVVQRTWDRENKEFLETTRKLIEQYTDSDLFILQIGLNSIASAIIDKPQNVIYVEEDVEVCKNYFLHKNNRCLLLLKGVEFYCNREDDGDEDKYIHSTLDLITKIYQNRNNQVIDVLIVSHKYPVALLYYVYPYMDSSTLVILMDNLNHQMKEAIFEYYNFIGEADFSRSFTKRFFNSYRKDEHNDSAPNENATHKYELNENTYIYSKMKQSPFYVITLNPKIMMNPAQNRYKSFISKEYTSSYETEITRMIKDIEKILKLNGTFYKKNKLLVQNYFSVINDFEFDNDEHVTKNVTDMLTSILKSFTITGDINTNNYNYALESLGNIFQLMLFNVYNNSKFKLLFTPLIDFFKLYLDKNDSNYIMYEFLLYGLIKNSSQVASYELKELLFLDVLRDVSKMVNTFSIREVIRVVTKLNILLKKLRSREDITHVKEYIKREFNLDYINNEL